MNVNATAFSTKSKDFIPMASGTGSSFPAANGVPAFNAQAGNFTPYSSSQPMPPQYFNYDAQSF